MAIEPGTVIAKRYLVHKQLGKGGMGEVFAAENTRTGRMVALKVLRAESKAKQSAIERFRREARAAGSISSDFVTQVLDVDDDPEHGIVLVFELLEGESLVDRLKRTGPISFVELWGIVEAVWMGLADAHAVGVVHRDLKPSNVFIEQRRAGRRVKILDFGISKLPKTISTESLTQVGQSLGTFSFMPPEQIGKAKNVDHRADIYACTTLIYQALSGKLPYKAKNVVAMMELKNKSEPRTLGEVMDDVIDPRLEAFIARGLARNPDYRFQTAAQALVDWRDLRPAGAMSVLDLEASGNYPQMIEDTPSSSEAKTIVIHRSAAERIGDLLPATVRHGSGSQPRPLLPSGEMGAMGHAGPTDTSTMPDPSHGQSPGPAYYELPHGHAADLGPDYGAGVGRDEMGEELLYLPPEPRSPVRVALALLLGAIGLMLVGFFTVALVLHLLG